MDVISEAPSLPPIIPNSRKINIRKGLIINLVALVFTLLCYACAYVSPGLVVMAGFLAFLIPLCIIGNLALATTWLFYRPRLAILPLSLIVLGSKFIGSFIAFHPLTDANVSDFKVVSYNVQTFKGYSKSSADKVIYANRMMKWLSKSSADVLCLQEVFDQPESFIYNSRTRLRKAGYSYQYYSIAQNFGRRGTIGMLIASKYPLETTGNVFKNEANNNQIIFADVILPKGNIRVYNVHLHSMRISEKEIKTYGTEAEVKRNGKSLFKKLSFGFKERVLQLKVLLRDLTKAPYPVLVCGDFNEIPSSYVYTSTRKLCYNAFEVAGNGFGITYNGFIPFLRIDNQFVDFRLTTTYFKTHQEVTYSDHFPIEAHYTFKK